MISGKTFAKRFAFPFQLGVCLFFLTVGWCPAQKINCAEYFFDTDPGPGNGTPITSFPEEGSVVFTETINTTGLAVGSHLLFIRTKSTDGDWSLYEAQEFFIDNGIIAAEYFFDKDPGIGGGIPLSVSSTGTITETIPTSGLSDGIHYLFVRTKHDGNIWSLQDPQIFFIRTRIVQAEYFIDTDPGFGSGTSISISSPDDLITITPTLSTSALPDGNHYLFIRTKDILGKWSFFEPMMFTVDAALPIELYDFAATATRDGRVKLQWTTATEINNDFFSVERAAAPEIEFATIFEIPGAGTTKVKTSYEEIDEKPYPGINYYRLKQTDFDGTFSYSKIVSAEVKKVTTVYPNPVVDNWTVAFGDAGNQSRTIEVLDLTGKKLADYKTQLTIVELKREGVPMGAHIVKITSPGSKPEFLKVSFQ
ncbi:MAG TPA: T9SS type A sorting domain-containing protein [Cyclobacteriaceae bacterium]|nr:T9SS type A sorting domain-containing protein [Cyclobacteriaceae bacterium]